MKKIIVLLMILLISIVPVAGSISIINNFKEIKQVNFVNTQNDFTHTVFSELTISTGCPYCPGASNTIYDIYDSDDYDFNYVSLVYNVGSEITKYKVTKRAYEELGINSVPQAYFDGKYSNVKGKPSDEDQYRSKIENAGVRDVPDIDINLNVIWQDNSVLDISGTVQNNEEENYNGHLRLYIVEPESRWNDAEGNPIHFGVLDIPIDKNLALKKSSGNTFKISSENYDFSNTWRGPIIGYDDISIDNIMVMATVFDKETDHAFQVTSARPNAMIPTIGYTNVTAEESWEMLNNHSTIQYPIDVRTIPEWDLERIDTPAPEDPILYADLQHGVALEEFMEEYADKEVLIYCRSGNRSYIATKLLLDNGFTGKIWQMVGGIKAWQAEGFPTKPKYSVLINVRIEKTESDQGIISIEDNVYPIYDYEAVPCGTVGCYNVELPAGEYDITVSDVEGYKDQTKTVEIEKDEEITFNFPKGKSNLLNLIFDLIEQLFEKRNFPLLN